jgi:uncharacterized protein
MKVAIVGSGISGLVAAYRLHPHHEITLFEANDYIGGHTNTVQVDWQGDRQAIDTGFIVFNDWTYPHFIALLNELGVASQPSCMSFSVRDERSGLEYNGHSLNTLFAQRSNFLSPRFYRMVWDILRFNRLLLKHEEQLAESITVKQFLQEHALSREFAEHYLLPMGAAIWSCPLGTFEQFPIRFIAEFYRNHGLLSVRHRPTWRVIQGGSQAYVKAMTRGFQHCIHLRTPVLAVQRLTGGVMLHARGRAPEQFDHVIFACHSDQALRILGEHATAAEREILSAFPYQKNNAVLHTDTHLLPRTRRAWASWNYRVYGDAAAPASVTYNMNLLQNLQSPHTYCVTLNDEERSVPDKVIAKFEYHHPVFTTQRAAMQSRHRELINVNHTSFCGAYWRNGFHEDGVVSALAVVKQLLPQGVKLPDEKRDVIHA